MGVRVAGGASTARLERALDNRLPSQGLVSSCRNLGFSLRAVQMP